MADKKQALMTVHQNLHGLINSKRDAMPRGFNETRFLQNCMTVLQDTKDIEKMEPVSVARTMLKGAFLGLDFFNKECYAIPYGTTLQFQTDYKGEIKLAKKYSTREIRSIYAKVVREGDEYEEGVENGAQTIYFKPKPFSSGEMIGAFAVCSYIDGTLEYASMSKDDIEAIRKNFSKMPKSLMWEKTPEEGYKKTVLRRLCKMIELDFESAEQKQAFEDGGDSRFVDAEFKEIKPTKPEGVKRPTPKKKADPKPDQKKQPKQPAEGNGLFDPVELIKDTAHSSGIKDLEGWLQAEFSIGVDDLPNNEDLHNSIIDTLNEMPK